MENYQFIGRNIEVTDAMRNYAEEKLSKLSRFADEVSDTKVVMSYKEGKGKRASAPAKVEVQMQTSSGLIRAEERHADTYTAIDKVVDKLERQIKRHKGRAIAQRRRHTEVSASAIESNAEQIAPLEKEPEVVRVKRHTLRPMSPEDAAMQMEDLGHNFYMFHNLETDKISVLYLRDDGDYGLLEPADA